MKGFLIALLVIVIVAVVIAVSVWQGCSLASCSGCFGCGC